LIFQQSCLTRSSAEDLLSPCKATLSLKSRTFNTNFQAKTERSPTNAPSSALRAPSPPGEGCLSSLTRTVRGSRYEVRGFEFEAFSFWLDCIVHTSYLAPSSALRAPSPQGEGCCVRFARFRVQGARCKVLSMKLSDFGWIVFFVYRTP